MNAADQKTSPLEGLNADEALQMGLAAHKAGYFGIAEKLYRQAIKLNSSATALHHLGLLLRGVGRDEEALEVLRSAIRFNPQLPASRHALGMTHLKLGDYAHGWPLYEARLEAAGYTPNLAAPMWRGEDRAGKRIAIFPEQGLGNSIQFARFVPVLRERGADVVLLCRPSLETLFRHNFPDVAVSAAAGTVDLGDLDYWVMMLSIPGHLGSTGLDWPQKPYLTAPHPHASSTSRTRVGLVTKGNPNQQNDARRSLNDNQAAQLAALPTVDVVSLHPEITGAVDFAETADIIAGLDLVVAVDSAVGHLAGAMGKPTLLLVPGFGADWRWGSGSQNSVWYPQHRLFRSNVNGDWDAALADVEAAVVAWPRSEGSVLSHHTR